jgi:hypothetical protein
MARNDENLKENTLGGHNTASLHDESDDSNIRTEYDQIYWRRKGTSKREAPSTLYIARTCIPYILE